MVVTIEFKDATAAGRGFSTPVVWEVAGLGMNPIPQPVQFRDTVILMIGCS